MNRLVVLLAGGFLFSGCGDGEFVREFQLDEAAFDEPTIRMIEQNVGFDMPDGTRGLNFAYKPPIDPAFLARLEIPAEALGPVTGHIDALKEERVNASGGLAERMPWWRPSQGKVLLDKQVFDHDNGTRLHVILADEGGRLILYVDWMT